MEINLFSKCIKDLIIENDRVDVPYLGTFVAEMVPAAYSDRQTTINPPYRKMSFHKGEISLADGRILLEKVSRETGVSLDQSGVELGWCLSRLCSELEGSKICKLPGLGVMRANARNEFFFVPDDNLDIWPDGLGLEPVAIKLSDRPAAAPAVAEKPLPELSPVPAPAPEPAPTPVKKPRKRRDWLIVLIVILVVLLLFIAAAYAFPEQLSPILDPLLYTREELELLGR